MDILPPRIMVQQQMGPLKSNYCLLYNVITPCPGLWQSSQHISTGTCPRTPKKGPAVETERVPRVETKHANL